jgi:hypothetical protein
MKTYSSTIYVLLRKPEFSRQATSLSFNAVSAKVEPCEDCTSSISSSSPFSSDQPAPESVMVRSEVRGQFPGPLCSNQLTCVCCSVLGGWLAVVCKSWSGECFLLPPNPSLFRCWHLNTLCLHCDPGQASSSASRVSFWEQAARTYQLIY